MAKKTVKIDQGSFLGKKDFTKDDFINEWVAWSLQLATLIKTGDTENIFKYADFKNWVKDLAAQNFDTLYETQQKMKAYTGL